MFEVDMMSMQTIMVTYVATSVLGLYYVYNRLQNTVEQLASAEEEVERLRRRLELKTRSARVYRYMVYTQKKAEQAYHQDIVELQQEISELREFYSQEQDREEVGKKRTIPVFTMTLRPRDETGKIKRRKLSDGTDSESDNESE